MENFIVYNAIRTPDGTILESKHRHDYVSHIDSLNNQQYVVDGGYDYLRRSIPVGLPYDELSLHASSPFEELRKVLKRGTYGKNGDEELKFIPLSEMSDEHVKNCIKYNINNNGVFSNNVIIYYRELYYRCENNITIEE